jgi:phosphoesterase RecJ-like protein
MTEAVCDDLQHAKAISLVIHERPDGDAVGSAAALYYHFNQTKRVEIVSTTPIPSVFEKITGQLPIVSSPTTDFIVLLDCAQLHRTGIEHILRDAKQREATLIAFDHHKKFDLRRMTDRAVHDPEASSTAEVLYDCFRFFRSPISAQVAQCLLLGIYTDTGGFQHANTTSRTLQAASKLIRLGADLQLLQSTFDNHRTLGKTKIWGRALSEIRLDNTGLATAVITAEALREANASEQDVAGLANTLALLDQARASAVLVEVKNGWRATLRTRHSDIDLRRLAKYFEGKGMQKATGFFATNGVISGKIKATEKSLADRARNKESAE